MKKIGFSLLVVFPLLFLWNSSIAQSRIMHLKVMTYNIKHGAAPGLSNADHQIDLDTLAEIIREQDPDIVALQEVDSMWSRSENQKQTKVLAEKTGMSYYYYGNTRTFDQWGYGNAILSKYKLVDTHTLHYPYRYHKGAENRVAAIATVLLPGNRKIKFVSTHLDYQHVDTRKLEAQAINDIAAYSDLPVILSGDLNSSLQDPLIAELRQQYIQSCQPCAPSFPSQDPKVKLDYIMYAKSSPFRVKTTRVIQNKKTAFASDHCPYIATFTWEDRQN